VAFFAYPGGRSTLLPPGCAVHLLCDDATEPTEALAALADVVAAGVDAVPALARRPDPPTGPLTPATVAQVLGARLAEGTIVVDEANTSGVFAEAATAGCPPHDWLRLTGGSIGIGLPLALGAAIAAPDRKVVALQADGSGLYTVQALWSLARENCDVVVLLFNNRSYAILGAEMERMGVVAGPQAASLVDLHPPVLDFVLLARGFGVDAVRVTSSDELDREFVVAQREHGPRLIEVML
jgi:acetolactate synthase-1/2/3 large subunit